MSRSRRRSSRAGGGAALATRAFWVVSGGFFLARLASGALTLHLVPLLTERELSARAAAGAAGAVGLTQLAGRLFFTPIAGRLRLARLTAAVFAVHALGLALLLAAPRAVGGAVPRGVWAFVALYGASNGAITLARALLVADFFGTRNYGQIAGWVALLVSLGTAAAPLAAGAAHDAFGGYDAVLAALVACTAAAAGLLAVARPPRPPLPQTYL